MFLYLRKQKLCGHYVHIHSCTWFEIIVHVTIIKIRSTEYKTYTFVQNKKNANYNTAFNYRRKSVRH